MMAPRPILLVPILLALWACAAPPTGPARTREGAPVIAVYQVAHDGHTGIAVPRANIPAGLWPESREFPHAEYLEVGWGQRDFYYGRNQGLLGTLRAMLPSPSVLHVAGFRGPPADYFRASEIVELTVSADGFERLVRYIHDAHERADALPVAALGPGLYGDSRFYPARESFHLLRTCNVWTAQALRAAGLPFRDSITMEGLLSQGRELGKSVNRPRTPARALGSRRRRCQNGP
jgi:uncharacterized protein (TIGR02117 family)